LPINVWARGKSMEGNQPNPDKFVSMQNVTKRFGNFKALSDISLDIREGEIFGYIGPNGAGKTTTIKILVGLISNFQGQVSVGGYQLPQKKEEAHKLLGYLPQNVAFQEWRTINQALKTFGKLSGLTDAQVEEKIPKILELLGLAEVRHKKITHLSGGMNQKVGLAQALLHEPKLLVLDEPMGGLDPYSRYQFKEIIRKLGQKGTTIIFSSHILSDVQDVADRIGIINRGTIKQIATLNDLKARFKTKKTVEVLLATENQNLQGLSKIKDVIGVEQSSPCKVLVNLEANADETQAVFDIAQYIVKLKIRIRGITVVEPSLDQIYLNYVQEGQN
jgi:ABC-2 type transport system ATP-binding protein